VQSRAAEGVALDAEAIDFRSAIGVDLLVAAEGVVGRATFCEDALQAGLELLADGDMLGLVDVADQDCVGTRGLECIRNG